MKGDQISDPRNTGGQNQEGLVTAMMDPSFYPTLPLEVTHQETHISHLFFAGELVYKIKKPVRYSFLDYSTLAKRKHFISEELRLNRRLAPSVYLAIVPITADGRGCQLGGLGKPVEYALVMRRLPEKRMLPFLLETRQVTPKMMGELAEVLARYHSQAGQVSMADTSGYPTAVEKEWNNNLKDIEPLAGNLIEVENLITLKDFGARFVDRHRQLLVLRARQGWIRDVHGDLHCEHVCFAPEGIQIFDCIEFNPQLRCCDLASEVAFILMDLEVRGGGALVKPFQARYSELLPDAELSTLLPFYQSYRALVRGKVHALRSADEAATRYFRFAVRFTWEHLKPFLVIVCGLTGSGKSVLARELGERLGMPVINSDVVRKAMTGESGRQTAAFNTGIYHPAMTEKTYAKMAREAEKEILGGNGAILDATFGQKNQRNKIIRLAEKQRVPLLLIHCIASRETTRKRLTQRAREGIDISDGRWEIYAEQAAMYQPFDEFVFEDRLEINTEFPLEQLARASEQFLRRKLKTVS